MSEQRRYQNTAATQFIATVDMPIQHEYKERPLRLPTFSADVFGVVLLLFVFAGIAGWAFSDSWQKGIGIGALAAVAGIVWRTNFVFDRPLAHIQETTYQEAQAEPDESTRYANRNTINGSEPIALTRRGKTVEFGDNRYTFTGKMLDAMLKWYEDGNKQLRRDSGTAGPGLREIGIGSNDYPAVIEILRGRGIIDAGNVFTAVGENWLRTE